TCSDAIHCGDKLTHIPGRILIAASHGARQRVDDDQDGPHRSYEFDECADDCHAGAVVSEAEVHHLDRAADKADAKLLFPAAMLVLPRANAHAPSSDTLGSDVNDRALLDRLPCPL